MFNLQCANLCLAPVAQAQRPRLWCLIILPHSVPFVNIFFQVLFGFDRFPLSFLLTRFPSRAAASSKQSDYLTTLRFPCQHLFQKPFGINRVLLLSSVLVRFVPPPLRDSLVRLPHSPSLVNTFFLFSSFIYTNPYEKLPSSAFIPLVGKQPKALCR